MVCVVVCRVYGGVCVSGVRAEESTTNKISEDNLTHLHRTEQDYPRKWLPWKWILY